MGQKMKLLQISGSKSDAHGALIFVENLNLTCRSVTFCRRDENSHFYCMNFYSTSIYDLSFRLQDYPNLRKCPSKILVEILIESLWMNPCEAFSDAQFHPCIDAANLIRGEGSSTFGSIEYFMLKRAASFLSQSTLYFCLLSHFQLCPKHLRNDSFFRLSHIVTHF